MDLEDIKQEEGRLLKIKPFVFVLDNSKCDSAKKIKFFSRDMLDSSCDHFKGCDERAIEFSYLYNGTGNGNLLRTIKQLIIQKKTCFNILIFCSVEQSAIPILLTNKNLKQDGSILESTTSVLYPRFNHFPHNPFQEFIIDETVDLEYLVLPRQISVIHLYMK